MKLTKKQAKELCIKKWTFLSLCKYDGGEHERMLDKYPDLRGLNNSCGYCDKYRTNNEHCNKCPLYKVWGMSCYYLGSIFQKWCRTNDPIKEKKLAKQILADIKRS